MGIKKTAQEWLQLVYRQPKNKTLEPARATAGKPTGPLAIFEN